MDDDETLRLIDSLYEAAVRPDRWPAFLELLSAILRANGTAFLHQDLQTRNDMIVAMVGLSATEAKQYEEHYARSNPYIQAASHGFKVGTVVADEEVCSPERLRHSECFHDFFKPRGFVHVLGAVIGRDGASSTNLSVQRGHRAGAFTGTERLLVERLMPHMQRVVQIHRRLAGAELTGSLPDVADLLPSGLVLTDARGRALFVNRAAREILESRDGLAILRSRVSAVGRADAVALHRLIGTAAADANGRGRGPGGAMSVSRPSMSRPYLVVVAPIRGNTGEAWLAPRGASVAVFISDPERRVESRELWLRRTYGLTAAEARLADLITGGASLTEATATLGVTKETARSHLKRTFEKTNTRRQGELIGLILRTVSGLPVACGEALS